MSFERLLPNPNNFYQMYDGDGELLARILSAIAYGIENAD
jgi:hypothetical protein